MERLPNDIEGLKEIIRQLLEKIRGLEAENSELRRRLGMDSTNSDKPPSSDGYKKKPVKPGLPKEKKGRGGQEGHKGKTLKREPDHIQIQIPEQCQCCGRQFRVEEAQILQSRQVFDLPEPKREVTEYRLGQIECCGILQRGE